MTHQYPRILTAALMLGTTILTACGGSAPSALPLAPSSLGAAASSRTSLGRSASTTFAPQTLAPMSESELRGAVAGLTGVCPDITFMVGSGGEAVTADAATLFPEGGCTMLHDGTLVQVRATMNAEGRLTALSVTLQDEPPAEGAIAVEGTLASLRGACPVLTFLVHGTRIVTSETTIFRGGRCEQLVTGSRVTVHGTPHINGTLVASQVRITPQPEDDEAGDDAGGSDDDDDDDGTGEELRDEVQRDGTVSSLRGACPNLTFNLKGTTVVTNAATIYTGGSCATLRPSVKVAVTGTGVERRGLVALRIAIARTR